MMVTARANAGAGKRDGGGGVSRKAGGSSVASGEPGARPGRPAWPGTPQGERAGGGGAPAAPAPGERLCLAAMLLGIAAVIVPFAELVLSVPAVVCAAAGLRRLRRLPEARRDRGRAWAGLALGLIGLALCVPSVVILRAVW